MATNTDIPARIENVLVRLTEHVAGGKPLSAEQQVLAGRLVNTLPYLERLKNSRVNVAQAELAAEVLIQPESQLQLASEIIAELERRIVVYRSAIRSILAGRSPISQLLLGMGAHVIVLLPLTGLMWRYWDKSAVGVLVGGSLGGLVSLLIRLHDFAVLARWGAEADPKVLFFTGLLKPVVSIVLAFFVWAALETGLVTLPVFNQLASPVLAKFALAFVTGFSERLAPDIANRVLPGPPTDAA